MGPGDTGAYFLPRCYSKIKIKDMPRDKKTRLPNYRKTMVVTIYKVPPILTSIPAKSDPEMTWEDPWARAEQRTLEARYELADLKLAPVVNNEHILDEL